MNLGDGEQLEELLKAQAHAWNHIFSFINSMSLKCAIQLNIPDIINNNHGKPMSISHLVKALPIHPSKSRCVYRLMRLLVHSGFFALQTLRKNDPEQGYVLTNASKIFLRDNPLSVAPFLLAVLDPILTSPWHHMSSWFQNDDPTPFVTTHGRTFWDYTGHEPMLNHFFNDAMASDSSLVTSVVINKRKEVFEGLKSLVDVGGGTGTVAKAIAKAFPHLDCTVLDLPHVVQGLEDTDNLKFVGGDMFESIPPADAILLKWILHNWNDEECVKILKRSKEAIKEREGGKVIIIDMKMENEKGDDESIETQLFFDMLMMVSLTGQERNEKKWAKIIFSAGFNDYNITPILGLRSLIELYP